MWWEREGLMSLQHDAKARPEEMREVIWVADEAVVTFNADKEGRIRCREGWF
jgi:hypothetical protein